MPDNMIKYCKYLFIVIILIINTGFILTFFSKQDVPVELIDLIDYPREIEVPHFEIITKDITNSDVPCLMAYGCRVKKIEYCPDYIFADDWTLLRDNLQSDKRTLKGTFLDTHPYHIEYEDIPGKIFIYMLPPVYLGVSGCVYLMK